MANTEMDGQPVVGTAGEQQEQEQPTMPGSPPNNNNVDPAILKAMDPQHGSNLLFP